MFKFQALECSDLPAPPQLEELEQEGWEFVQLVNDPKRGWILYLRKRLAG